MTYYKILLDGKSCNGGNLEWSLPKGNKMGKWHKVDGELVMCRHGLHLATEPYQCWFRNLNCDVYEAEAKEIVGRQHDKIVCRQARLLKKVDAPKWLQDARDFIATIPEVLSREPDGKPLKKWRLFESENTARSAGRSVLWDPDWLACRGVARDATWEAARDAAWNATWEAVESVTSDSRWDAALLARCLIVQDKIPAKHLRYARDRWRAYEKGYRVIGGVDGVLSVYPKETK